MNEFKPWLTEGEPAEICRLLRLARDQQPSPEAFERFIDRVRVRRPTARAQNIWWFPFAGAARSAGDLLASCVHRSTRIRTLRRGVCVGAIALAAAALAATRLRNPSRDSDVHVDSPGSLADRNSPRLEEKLAPAAAPSVSAIQSPRPRESLAESEPPPLGFRGVAPRAKRSPTTTPRSPSTPRLLDDPTQGYSRPAHGVSCSSRERSVVDEARRALGEHRPAAALTLLRDYEQQCSFRSFLPEALQIRMRSQAVLGQSQSARETARVLARRFAGTAPGQEALRFLGPPGSMAF